MRQLWSALFALWTIGLLVVALIFFVTLHWDHTWGHPPYIIWAGIGVYFLVGGALFKGAWRSPNKAP